jgi:hypothetical protein
VKGGIISNFKGVSSSKQKTNGAPPNAEPTEVVLKKRGDSVPSSIGLDCGGETDDGRITCEEKKSFGSARAKRKKSADQQPLAVQIEIAEGDYVFVSAWGQKYVYLVESLPFNALGEYVQLRKKGSDDGDDDAYARAPLSSLTLLEKAAPMSGSSSESSSGVTATTAAMCAVTADIAKPLGLEVEHNDRRCLGVFVKGFVAGGHAEVEGTLRPGDRIEAVDGAPTAGKSFDEVTVMLRSAPGPRVVIMTHRSQPILPP